MTDKLRPTRPNYDYNEPTKIIGLDLIDISHNYDHTSPHDLSGKLPIYMTIGHNQSYMDITATHLNLTNKVVNDLYNRVNQLEKQLKLYEERLDNIQGVD